MQEKLRRAAFKLAEAASRLNVLHLLLFGSAAEGTDQNSSDLDFFVVFDTEKKDISSEESEILRIVRQIEKKHRISIDILFSNRKYDGIETYFLQKAFGSGTLLYSQSPQVMLNGVPLQPYAFIIFTLKGLSQSQKMKVRNRLYGYRTVKRKGGREYTSSSRGLLNEIEGKRLGMAAILVPKKNLGVVKRLFQMHSVNHFEIDTWMFH